MRGGKKECRIQEGLGRGAWCIKLRPSGGSWESDSELEKSNSQERTRGGAWGSSPGES